MAGTPAETPPSGGSESDSSEEREAQMQAAERYGPLAVARHRKEDGRALILYSRTDTT